MFVRELIAILQKVSPENKIEVEDETIVGGRHHANLLVDLTGLDTWMDGEEIT